MKPFLTADWRHLLMINYVIDPAVLASRVPRGTELDLFEEQAYVSLVGFRFLNTRVLGFPVPGHRDFDEINLRFYVRRLEGEEIKRGVCFVKEIVPRRAIAWVARTCYHEPYACHPMEHRLDPEERPQRAEYAWHAHGSRHALTITTKGEAVVPSPSSEEAFIAEHYWGYCAQPNGGTMEYEVRHPSWRVWRAASASAEVDVTANYGPAFADALSRPPQSAFLADGSAVTVMRGRLLSG